MIREQLRHYIQDSLLNGSTVSDDENLLLSGLLDSLAIMSLVAHIETTFKISVPFEDVLIENFESIAAIDTYLSTRLENA